VWVWVVGVLELGVDSFVGWGDSSGVVFVVASVVISVEESVVFWVVISVEESVGFWVESSVEESVVFWVESSVGSFVGVSVVASRVDSGSVLIFPLSVDAFSVSLSDIFSTISDTISSAVSLVSDSVSVVDVSAWVFPVQAVRVYMVEIRIVANIFFFIFVVPFL
jgi:hypothetical protein